MHTPSWTCCCVRWHGIKHLSQIVLYFSTFLSVRSVPFVRWKTKRNHIQSGKKNDERRSREKKKQQQHWWQFQTLNDVWYACDKKNISYIQMCFRTHSTIFHRLMFRLVEWRIGADASYDFGKHLGALGLHEYIPTMWNVDVTEWKRQIQNDGF